MPRASPGPWWGTLLLPCVARSGRRWTTSPSLPWQARMPRGRSGILSASRVTENEVRVLPRRPPGHQCQPHPGAATPTATMAAAVTSRRGIDSPVPRSGSGPPRRGGAQSGPARQQHPRNDASAACRRPIPRLPFQPGRALTVRMAAALPTPSPSASSVGSLAALLMWLASMTVGSDDAGTDRYVHRDS